MKNYVSLNDLRNMFDERLAISIYNLAANTCNDKKSGWGVVKWKNKTQERRIRHYSIREIIDTMSRHDPGTYRPRVSPPAEWRGNVDYCVSVLEKEMESDV